MRKILIVIIVFLSVISCSDDFLDKGPIAKETSDSFFNNDENAMKALYAVYNVIRGRETYGCNKWAIGSIGSDLAEAGGSPGGSDIMDMQLMDRLMQDNRNVNVVEWYWYGWYAGIMRANLVLENIENNSNITPELHDRIVGEAYALRGLFYLELAMSFGQVPIIDHVLSTEEYTEITQSNVHEVIQFAISNFNSAIGYLEQFPGERIQGRVDISTALALKVKALVYESSYSELSDTRFAGCQNKWSSARQLANEIIANEATYGIGLISDYHNIWRKAYETEGEFLLSASSTIIPGMEGGHISDGGSSFESRESTSAMISVMQSPRRYFETPSSASRPAKDGWGFNVPTQKFVDMFNPDDPRLGASVVFNQTPWNYWDHGNVYLSTEESPTGYSCLKYVMYGDEFLPHEAVSHASNLDVKIYRYADFLLLAAEANLKAGDPATALELVNRVRTRARNSGTTGQPVDLTSVSMDDIIHERALELGMEGHRYFDLVRTGRTNAMNGSNNFNQTIQEELTFKVGKHEFLPIPAGEIVRSGGALKQNNGY